MGTIRLDPRATAVVAIDMYRGHLDPSGVALPLPVDRCAAVVRRAAALFADVRRLGVCVVHVEGDRRRA
jgi:nicotinamidase-related amidase